MTNWTRYGGYIGEPFTVESVTDFSVKIIGLVPVPKRDFAFVFGVWPDYLTGKMTRPEIGDHTRWSKYIISILHQTFPIQACPAAMHSRAEMRQCSGLPLIEELDPRVKMMASQNGD